MKLGLIGLKNTGKTTLFNALTRADAATSSHAFSGSKPNIGRVNVPDERLEKLAEIFKPKKLTPAFVEFVDIAGLSKSSDNTEPGGNKFLIHIREVDALVHVVRYFDIPDDTSDNENMDNGHDLLKDIEAVNLELIISDMEAAEKRIETIEKKTRLVSTEEKFECSILKKIYAGLENGAPSRNTDLNETELKAIKSLGLLTLKPVIYCINIAEKDLSEKEPEPGQIKNVREYARKENSEAITVCAKIEEEISRLDPEDRALFLKELNIGQSGLDKLIKASYGTLGYISFLTTGADEVRAWTIKNGDKALKAAGKIHSDIERGFIRAETISYPAFMDSGCSFVKAREKGLLRSEGKEYIVKDGDIIDFKFNV
jgi:ribosome-binding ATPase